MADKVNWNKLKAEYIKDPRVSYRILAEKYGVSETVVNAHGRKMKWVEARKEYQAKTYAKAMEKATEHEGNKLAKLICTTEKAIEVVAKAFEDERQFNRYLVEKREEFVVGDMPQPTEDNPAPPIVKMRQWTEEQQFSKVDTRAIRDLTAVLKDLTGMMRDFYNIPTPGEAEARRIAAGRFDMDQKRADNADGPTVVQVQFAEGLEDYTV